MSEGASSSCSSPVEQSGLSAPVGTDKAQTPEEFDTRHPGMVAINVQSDVSRSSSSIGREVTSTFHTNTGLLKRKQACWLAEHFASGYASEACLICLSDHQLTYTTLSQNHLL